jgi:hypothetical protein
MREISPPSGYETSDAPARLIASLAAGIGLFVLATPFVLLLVFPGAANRGGIGGDLPQPPAPMLQAHPQSDLARFRAAEDTTLHSAGWVDRDHGVIRIPLARAIQLLSQRGLDGWPGPARAPAAPPPSQP